MITEIYNIMYNHNLTPVLAHIDRYLQWYSAEDMSRLLSIREATLQINTEALYSRKSLKFVLTLIREGFPIIFGSDAHNITDRPPDMETAYKTLMSNLKNDELSKIIELHGSLI
jgi:protein-tyrosine phosphatase